MATLWQKKKGGVWYITYRMNGKQVARSLRTQSKREAVRLRQEIVGLLADAQPVSFRISESDESKQRNPRCDEFWTAFLEWLQVHRSPSTVEEYANWFKQIMEYTGAQLLGDITRHDIEAL